MLCPKHFRHFQIGLIPICVAFCLMVTSNRTQAAVITSSSGVISADSLSSDLSSPDLQVWSLARAAVVKTTRGCLFVDLDFMNRGLNSRISGLLLSVHSSGRLFLLDTSSSSSSSLGGSDDGGRVLIICGSEFASSPGVAAWVRAMKLGSLSAVPPDELLRPPRN